MYVNDPIASVHDIYHEHLMPKHSGIVIKTVSGVKLKVTDLINTEQ